jgi:hypothetical protein
MFDFRETKQKLKYRGGDRGGNEWEEKMKRRKRKGNII